MIFYYSGCGNSRWVAGELAKATGEDLAFIPDLQRDGIGRYSFSADETAGFVFPVYAWAAPRLVEEFVLDTKWEGRPAYTWFACTCGDDSGMTYRTFARTLSRAGLQADGKFCFLMPETYLCFPGFSLDSPENAERKIAGTRARLAETAEAIRGRRQTTDMIVGSFPRFKSYVIRPAFIRLISDAGYRSTESCNGCGLCAKVCPLKNIVMKDGHPAWQGHCTQCMACYHHCPKNAIHYRRMTEGKGQYYFGK